jgi:twinkle protein
MQKQKEGGKMEIPNLYDINGSANFFNKTDFGITVYRDFFEKIISVHVQKVKFKHLGEIGSVNYVYNQDSGRFVENGISIEAWDNKNWIGSNIPVQEYERMQPNRDFYNNEKYEAPF